MVLCLYSFTKSRHHLLPLWQPSQSNFRTRCGRPVQKFAQPWFKRVWHFHFVLFPLFHSILFLCCPKPNAPLCKSAEAASPLPPSCPLLFSSSPLPSLNTLTTVSVFSLSFSPSFLCNLHPRLAARRRSASLCTFLHNRVKRRRKNAKWVKRCKIKSCEESCEM